MQLFHEHHDFSSLGISAKARAAKSLHRRSQRGLLSEQHFYRLDYPLPERQPVGVSGLNGLVRLPPGLEGSILARLWMSVLAAR